jgi:peptidoglycan/LPS O-acetylase OafA/YrhL
VVFSHLTPYVLQPIHNDVYEYFDPGLYGVLVFFLVSGYIVPASLERKGSIRTFWLGRVFRLFPLFVVAIAGVLLLHGLGYVSLRGTNHNTTASVFAHILILGGVALAVAGNRLSRKLGAWLAAATGLILLVFNERQFACEGLTILAVMFTGTLLYRAERGQVSRRNAVPLAVGVFAAAIGAGAWHIPAIAGALPDSAVEQRLWVISVALAGLTFAVGFALRKVRIPTPLAWLGVVSYSVYLLHPLLIDCYDAIPFTHGTNPLWLQALMMTGYLAVLLACCAVTYYLVEAPAT